MARFPTEPRTAERHRPTPLAVGIGVFGLVFLVAFGSNRSSTRIGGPRHVLHGGAFAGDLGVVLGTLSLLVLGGIAWLFLRMLGVRRGKGSDEPETVFEEPDTEWWEKPLLLGMALLPIAGLIAAVVVLVHHAKSVTNPTQTTGVTPPLTTAVATTPSQGASPHSSGLAVDWWLVAALAVVLAVAGAVLLFARRRRQRGLGVDSERRVSEEAFELQAVIEESLAELEREPDPRRAVIRAYTGMERTLARRGLGRRPFEAPLEYLARSLVALQVSRPAGERLTELFQRARFSTHDVEPASKQEAITALRRVRDELAERSE